MKICKDGRIWGQNNKLAGSHLGLLVKKQITTGLGKGKYIRTKAFRKKERKSRSGNKHYNFGKAAWNKGIPCSVKTRNKISKATKMENNPNWKGGISFEIYTPTFNQQLKDRIRVRDNFVCQLCGIPELELDKRLDVHHKDYNKKNCIEQNLISLCRSCHLKTNYNREKWINKFYNLTNKVGSK